MVRGKHSIKISALYPKWFGSYDNLKTVTELPKKCGLSLEFFQNMSDPPTFPRNIYNLEQTDFFFKYETARPIFNNLFKTNIF